ncbi:MAG TPA: PIG-L family deacetylase [Candidatus Sulfomarinibacteraceae bacterium]|nr:PIG-L family deacetylase [Candidatus Sulfomarinibacteraceae bacterium]
MNNSIFDRIYLSPHLDDVTLSCGGQIFQRTEAGQRVLIVTVAAGEPQTEVRSFFAEYLHHNWGLPAGEVVAMRRAEDEAAAEQLGAEVQHWTLPDAIYRLHPQTEEPLYTSNEDIFGPLHPAEQSLVQELAEMMARLPRAGAIVAPLAVGNHVDHQLVRRAADEAFGQDLLYYEDYPYVQRHPQSLQKQLAPGDDWQPQVISLSEEAIRARLGACLQYQSQLSTLFNDAQNMEAQVRDYVAQVGGERLWRRGR